MSARPVFVTILITGGSDHSRRDKISVLLKKWGVGESPNNPDLITVQPEEEKNSIGISQIRELHRILSLRSTSQSGKVVVFPAADLLTPEAQNSLLKTLEEPPVGVSIILAAPNQDLLLPTIISRCHLIELSSINSHEFSPEKIEETKDLLGKLSNLPLGQKLKLAAEIAVGRNESLSTIDLFLVSLHQSLPAQLSQSPLQPDLPNQTRQLLSAKTRLFANANPRLTIENLLLNW